MRDAYDLLHDGTPTPSRRRHAPHHHAKSFIFDDFGVSPSRHITGRRHGEVEMALSCGLAECLLSSAHKSCKRHAVCFSIIAADDGIIARASGAAHSSWRGIGEARGQDDFGLRRHRANLDRSIKPAPSRAKRQALLGRFEIAIGLTSLCAPKILMAYSALTAPSRLQRLPIARARLELMPLDALLARVASAHGQRNNAIKRDSIMDCFIVAPAFQVKARYHRDRRPGRQQHNI